MEVACVIFGVKPVLEKDPNSTRGKKIKNYWPSAKKELLKNAKAFMARMVDYDRDNMPEPTIKKLAGYCANPDFESDKVHAGQTLKTHLPFKALCSIEFARSLGAQRWVCAATKPSAPHVQRAALNSPN